MRNDYQARWISKQRTSSLRKTGGLNSAILLDSFNGFLIVEPVGSNLGDGEVLPRDTADYELQPVWCPGSKHKLVEARKLLHLEKGIPSGDRSNPG